MRGQPLPAPTRTFRRDDICVYVYVCTCARPPTDGAVAANCVAAWECLCSSLWLPVDASSLSEGKVGEEEINRRYCALFASQATQPQLRILTDNEHIYSIFSGAEGATNIYRYIDDIWWFERSTSQSIFSGAVGPSLSVDIQLGLWVKRNPESMDTGYMDCWITGLLIAYTACEREDV